MSEKKLGRGFKVGDKVRLTKAGEDSDFFATEFREGDTVEVMELNKFDGSVYRVMVTSGEAKGRQQTSSTFAITKTWFEHVEDEKARKKKRQYFRAGDFVVLKDKVDSVKVTEHNDFKHGIVGFVSDNERKGWVQVAFTTYGVFDYDEVRPEALRLATKEERISLRKYKIAKITYDNPCDNVLEAEQDTETTKKQVKIPPEYDVKVGDIVEVTKYCIGNNIGDVVKVVEVFSTLSPSNRDKYNNVKVVNQDGVEFYEGDVKLCSSHTKKFK